ncbi:zinc finger protein 42 homolog [Sorex araneus]|uniref:zinc finger protein 42 homolog n=1 Tax=Sorex araneus TaxID=42254 RepID=UPI0003315E95|nr:zinc finger protein 42 homolog [Sorex araneus]
MDRQLNNKAWTCDWKGQGRAAPRGTKRQPAQQAAAKPFTVTWDLQDEDVHSETSFQTGKAGEDSFSDCYIECIIRGEFSEPILDEDILLKSLAPGQELSQQVLAASSFIEHSLGRNAVEAKQAPSPQSAGENSLVEYSGYAAGINLNMASGGKPSIDVPVLKKLSEFAESMPRENTNTEHAVPENICPQHGCGKKFKDRASLKKHIRIHGPRDMVCAECGRAFLEKSKLNRHFLIHTGERPFQCTYEGCGKRFALDFNLRTHVRIHTNEKYYACPFKGCKKRFVRSNNLKVHVLTHGNTMEDQ